MATAGRPNSSAAAAQQNRRSLAIAMLVQGRALAFVDFFKLSSSRQSQPASVSSSDGGRPISAPAEQQQQPLPWPTLVLLQEQLVRGEDAAGRADPRDVETAFDASRTLAHHFTAHFSHPANAVFFWQRCLQVAVAASWPAGELEASCALGLLYESQHRPHLAIACHERCLELARMLQRPDDVTTAHAQLVQVFAEQAEECAAQGDTRAAAAFYGKCRDAALQCGDSVAAGAAAHHLGLLAQAAGDWQAALQHQRSFLEASRQAGDPEGEGRASVAVAECQQQLGQLQDAIASLEALLALPHSQAPRGQATAYCKLGVLCAQQGRAAEAVAHFERCYELARSLGERRLLDLARCNLGAARSASLLPGYLDLAFGPPPAPDALSARDSDEHARPCCGALLAWKCTRQPFA